MKYSWIALAVAVTLAFLVGNAHAGCDPWCALTAGRAMYNCTKYATDLNSTCACWYEERAVLDGCECFLDSDYYIYHYGCLSVGCNETICGDASFVSYSLVLSASVLAFLLLM
ncbi:hypothetical protein Pelo_3272 [Pelomyxa schiedti]|nr:hypothetical protein Pelo_3272 [Pelomyxa schiedti]